MVKGHIEPLLDCLKLLLREFLSGKIAAVTLGKVLCPLFKRLLEWSMCTTGCHDFSDLKPHASVIKTEANSAASKWTEDFFDADEFSEPATGVGSIILAERIHALALNVGKMCHLKMDAKSVKATFARAGKRRENRRLHSNRSQMVRHVSSHRRKFAICDFRELQ